VTGPAVDWLFEFHSAIRRNPDHSCSCSGDCDKERWAAEQRIRGLEKQLEDWNSPFQYRRVFDSSEEMTEWLERQARLGRIEDAMGGSSGVHYVGPGLIHAGAAETCPICSPAKRPPE